MTTKEKKARLLILSVKCQIIENKISKAQRIISFSHTHGICTPGIDTFRAKYIAEKGIERLNLLQKINTLKNERT